MILQNTHHHRLYN